MHHEGRTEDGRRTGRALPARPSASGVARSLGVGLAAAKPGAVAQRRPIATDNWLAGLAFGHRGPGDPRMLVRQCTGSPIKSNGKLGK